MGRLDLCNSSYTISPPEPSVPPQEKEEIFHVNDIAFDQSYISAKCTLCTKTRHITIAPAETWGLEPASSPDFFCWPCGHHCPWPQGPSPSFIPVLQPGLGPGYGSGLGRHMIRAYSDIQDSCLPVWGEQLLCIGRCTSRAAGHHPPPGWKSD